MEQYSIYTSPLSERYASSEMLYFFSNEYKYKLWRKIWLSLAKAEKQLGLNITDEDIKELEENVDNLNIEVAREYEAKLRHEIMSHIKAYGEQCPNAKKIIHLGATSTDILDNADIVQMRDGLLLIKKRLVNLINILVNFIEKYKLFPTLAYTHFQPAIPTTLGKRACIWLQDLALDYKEIEHCLSLLKLKGMKGATGTQSSYLYLFDGDVKKPKQLEQMIAKDLGFEGCFDIVNQTYTRKLDFLIMSCLSSICQSTHKFSNDMRLLQSLREIEEPFEAEQVGSSAMPFKRNPMRSERLASLSRFGINLVQNSSYNYCLQWLERTLDDSANKRISIPEAFLTADAVLILFYNIIEGINVNESVIKRNLNIEVPFLSIENILMEAVKRGADRQKAHEILRNIAMKHRNFVHENSFNLDSFINDLSSEKHLGLTQQELTRLMDIENFIGLTKYHIEVFLIEIREEVLKKNENLLSDYFIDVNV